jgi:hypothetical protein
MPRVPVETPALTVRTSTLGRTAPVTLKKPTRKFTRPALAAARADGAGLPRITSSVDSCPLAAPCAQLDLAQPFLWPSVRLKGCPAPSVSCASCDSQATGGHGLPRLTRARASPEPLPRSVDQLALSREEPLRHGRALPHEAAQATLVGGQVAGRRQLAALSARTGRLRRLALLLALEPLPLPVGRSRCRCRSRSRYALLRSSRCARCASVGGGAAVRLRRLKVGKNGATVMIGASHSRRRHACSYRG